MPSSKSIPLFEFVTTVVFNTVLFEPFKSIPIVDALTLELTIRTKLFDLVDESEFSFKMKDKEEEGGGNEGCRFLVY